MAKKWDRKVNTAQQRKVEIFFKFIPLFMSLIIKCHSVKIFLHEYNYRTFIRDTDDGFLESIFLLSQNIPLEN